MTANAKSAKGFHAARAGLNAAPAQVRRIAHDDHVARIVFRYSTCSTQIFSRAAGFKERPYDTHFKGDAGSAPICDQTSNFIRSTPIRLYGYGTSIDKPERKACMQRPKHPGAIVVAGAAATPHTQRLRTQQASTPFESSLVHKTKDCDIHPSLRSVADASSALHQFMACCCMGIKRHCVLNS